MPQTGGEKANYLKAIGMDPRQFWPKKYRFTREPVPGGPQPLSVSQRNFYEANGYILIDNCVSSRLMSALRDTQSSGDREKLLAKFTSQWQLLNYVNVFCDERVMLMSESVVDKLNQSPVHVSTGSYKSSIKTAASTTNIDTSKLDDNHEWLTPSERETSNQTPGSSVGHQSLYRDYIYLPFRPIDKIVCCISALEPIEQVLLVVPGTHKVGQCNIYSTSSAPLTLYESSPKDMTKVIDQARKPPRYINMRPGQTLFYHPALMHAFNNDLVNERRPNSAVCAYYAAADCEFIIDYQPQDQSNQQLQANADRWPLPPGLAHFAPDNPTDYRAWRDRPRLVRDSSNL